MKARALQVLLKDLFEAAGHPEVESVRVRAFGGPAPASVTVRFRDGSSGSLLFARVQTPNGHMLGTADYDIPEVAR